VRRSVTALLVVVAVVAGTAASCRPAPTLTVSTAVSGLSNPWDISFANGGTMFFTERVGRIDVSILGDTRVLATPADVVAAGEGGMMGIAADPAYAANRRIYTCMVSNASGAVDVRVVRWQVTPDSRALTARTDILTGITAGGGGRHIGCRLRFGPDGHLWVSTGDAAMGTTPQDPASLAGKVLRITTDGAGAPGNPGGALRPEIYSYGHRNPQGVAFAADGTPYSIEHGPDRDDEVNRLVPGGNYGWNPVPGYNEAVPMTDLVEFPGAIPAVWSSGTPTIAPSGGTFVRGAEWEGWDTALVMAVLKGQQLRVVRLAPGGVAVEQQYTAVTDRGRLRVAVQAPDGRLFLATDAGAGAGAILTVTPTG
jgi:aldose sugar dehydrogenase